MRVNLPYSNSYPYVRVFVITPKGERIMTVDRNVHSFADIELPPGVEDDEADVYSCFLNGGHKQPRGVGPVLIQAATRKSAPVVEPEPEPEPTPVVEPVDVEPAPVVEPVDVEPEYKLWEAKAIDEYGVTPTEPNIMVD